MPADLVPGENLLPVCGWQSSHHILIRQKGSKLSCSSSYEGINPIMTAPLSWLNYFPKAPSPITSHRGLGFQHTNFRETQIQSTVNSIQQCGKYWCVQGNPRLEPHLTAIPKIIPYGWEQQLSNVLPTETRYVATSKTVTLTTCNAPIFSIITFSTLKNGGCNLLYFTMHWYITTSYYRGKYKKNNNIKRLEQNIIQELSS